MTTFEAEEGIVETVAYYAFKQGIELPRSEILQALREAGFLFIWCLPSSSRSTPYR